MGHISNFKDGEGNFITHGEYFDGEDLVEVFDFSEKYVYATWFGGILKFDEKACASLYKDSDTAEWYRQDLVKCIEDLEDSDNIFHVYYLDGSYTAEHKCEGKEKYKKTFETLSELEEVFKAYTKTVYIKDRNEKG